MTGKKLACDKPLMDITLSFYYILLHGLIGLVWGKNLFGIKRATKSYWYSREKKNMWNFPENELKFAEIVIKGILKLNLRYNYQNYLIVYTKKMSCYWSCKKKIKK